MCSESNSQFPSKQCIRCSLIKPITDFYIRKPNKIYGHCKECNKKWQQEYKLKNPERVHAWKQKWEEKNKDKKYAYHKQYRHSIEGKRKRNEWIKNNKNLVSQYHAKCRSTEKFKINRRNYKKKKRKEDKTFAMKELLSHRLYMCVRKHYDSCTLPILLGCSIEDFLEYLESKFQSGMTWENQGIANDEWQIDHVIPCELFDLTDLEQQKICFNYRNLQPIWGKENRIKSDYIEIDGKRIQARNLNSEEKAIILKRLLSDFP